MFGCLCCGLTMLFFVIFMVVLVCFNCFCWVLFVNLVFECIWRLLLGVQVGLQTC